MMASNICDVCGKRILPRFQEKHTTTKFHVSVELGKRIGRHFHIWIPSSNGKYGTYLEMRRLDPIFRRQQAARKFKSSTDPKNFGPGRGDRKGDLRLVMACDGTYCVPEALWDSIEDPGDTADAVWEASADKLAILRESRRPRTPQSQ